MRSIHVLLSVELSNECQSQRTISILMRPSNFGMDVRVCEASLRVSSNISLLRSHVHRAPSTCLSLLGPRRDSKVSLDSCKSAGNCFLLEHQIHRNRRPVDYGGISSLSTFEFKPQYQKQSILTSLRRPKFESTPKLVASIRSSQPGRSACQAVPDEQSPGDNPEQPQVNCIGEKQVVLVHALMQ